MRRTAPPASQSSRAETKPPTPPPGGWTLMEAAEALCPDVVARYRQGGAALSGGGNTTDPFQIGGHDANALAYDLLQALCERPDVELTGQNLERGADADRYRMPHSLLIAAAKPNMEVPASAYRAWIHLDLRPGSVLFGFKRLDDDYPTRPPAGLEDVKLVTVRIEACGAPTSVGASMPRLASGGLVADHLSPPNNSLPQVGRSSVLRPLRFAIDAASECVLFEGGVKLRGQSVRLVSELLPRLLEGARAGRGPGGYKFVAARPLSLSLGVTEETLRRQIARLRDDLAGQFWRVHATTLLENDFIENRPWCGYRLNPFLVADVSLLRAAGAASGHVTHPDTDVTPFG